MGMATRRMATAIPMRTPTRTSTAATMAACTAGVDTEAMVGTVIAAATMAALGVRIMAESGVAAGSVPAVARSVVVVAPEAAGKKSDLLSEAVQICAASLV